MQIAFCKVEAIQNFLATIVTVHSKKSFSTRAHCCSKRFDDDDDDNDNVNDNNDDDDDSNKKATIR